MLSHREAGGCSFDPEPRKARSTGSDTGVRVFSDECVPRPLRNLLTVHEIKTAQEMGWHRMKNGELIRHAEENGFEVFVTSDQNVRYQQNLQGRGIALLVLSTNYWPALENHHELIASTLAVIHRLASISNWLFPTLDRSSGGLYNPAPGMSYLIRSGAPRWDPGRPPSSQGKSRRKCRRRR